MSTTSVYIPAWIILEELTGYNPMDNLLKTSEIYYILGPVVV